METHENIKRLRENLGLSQGRLAEMVGYKDRSSIAKIEAGRVDLSQSKIALIAAALHVTPAKLMGLSDTSTIPAGFEPLPDMVKIPIVGRIACGEPILAEENIEGEVSIPESWRATFCLTCRGDSMMPRIQDGDLVAIRKQEEVENGEIAAVRIDGEATLKHVYLYPNYIELRPENPAYESIIKIGPEMNEVVIEGKAVGLCRTI